MTRLSVAAALCATLVVLGRFCYLPVIWIEEAYGMAAAAQIGRGAELYREIWFDKPPLYAWYYLLAGIEPGLRLRVTAAVLILGCGVSVYVLASHLWSRTEGLLAASLLLFYLTFGVPSAVLAVAPDLLLMAPHALALYCAVSGRPFAAGLASGIGLLANPKAIFVLLSCFVWQWRHAPALLLGTLVPHLAAAPLLHLPAYWEQVWTWGATYSRDTFIDHPVLEGLRRTLNWTGFHVTAVAGAIICAWRERPSKLVLAMLISLAGVLTGLRFFPRYYFLLLVPVVILGARGLVLCSAWPRLQAALFLLLLIPSVRFGPRYYDVAATGGTDWTDLAMMRDSKHVGELIGNGPQGSASLLVWGYRPDVYVFSGLPAGTRFLDSQPLTGVLADRHLQEALPSFPALAKANRDALARTNPTYIVDGLGPLNPALAITQYQDLQHWLVDYRVVGTTPMSIVYRRQ